MQQRSDKDLLLSVRQGDEQALKSLFDRYRNLVFQKCLSFIDEEDVAMDITQEIFIRVWERAVSIDVSESANGTDQGTLKPLLYQMVRNACIDHLRKEKRYDQKKLHYGFFANLDAQTDTLAAEYEHEERWQWLVANVQNLSPRQREAFDLVVFQKVKPKKAAQMMGVDWLTLRLYLLRAKNALKAELAEPGKNKSTAGKKK